MECGLRMLFVLAAQPGKPTDLQRLVSYDYLLVHSSDVAEGPTSLHPDVPFRGSELLVKRDIVHAGLNQMFSRELLQKNFTMYGITYCSNALTVPFIRLLVSDYAQALRKRSQWLVTQFGEMSDGDLADFMNANVGRWGAEFERFTATRDLEL
ncbi:hypothetical protein G6L13_26065 [Agrobacterium tumefaciens]|nr:hypothetical protein [Agrobacterium tumefaciens]